MAAKFRFIGLTPIAGCGEFDSEVLATTVNGTVIAVAFDGTEVFRVQTGMDIPLIRWCMIGMEMAKKL